jgi:sugar porter (SP) family MFS transporter
MTMEHPEANAATGESGEAIDHTSSSSGMCRRRHKSMRSVIHAAAFSCFSMGFNSGIIAGALLYLDEYFEDIHRSTLLKGAVTASVFASAFLANLCVAPVADKYGRTLVLYMINIPFVAGALVSAFASSSAILIFGRAITGFAVGIAGTLPNLYIAEIVPPERRGRAVGMAPLYGTTGIMAAQFASWIVAEALGHENCVEMGWRIMFGMGILPPVIQLLWSIGLPESPRWCKQQGLFDRADVNTQYLESLGVKAEEFPAITPMTSVTDATANCPEERLGHARCAIAVGLSVMQQLSGVNAVIFYAPHLYTLLGVKANIAILIAGLNSVAQVMMTRIMTLIIDTMGRRCICLIGLVGMFIGLDILGFVFQDNLHLPASLAVLGVLIFRLSFSLSLGPLPYIMVTELFPQKQRARGVATSMATNWLLNWAVVFAVPYLMECGQGAVFFAFAGVCVISAIIVDMYLPETAGRNLEDNLDVNEGTLRRVFRMCKREKQPALLDGFPDVEANKEILRAKSQSSEASRDISQQDVPREVSGTFSFPKEASTLTNPQDC